MSSLSYLASQLPLVKTLQSGTISIANATGGTAAITAVSTSRSLVVSAGSWAPSAATAFAYNLYLNSATQVKVDTQSSTGLGVGSVLYFQVVEFR